MTDRPIIDQAELAGFCRTHHIRKVSFFGSVLRDDFGPESDVDVLVEVAPGIPMGLIRLAGMELELEELLGRKVDLCLSADLREEIHDRVCESARVQYAA